MVRLRIKFGEFWASLPSSGEVLPTYLRKTDCWHHLFCDVCAIWGDRRWQLQGDVFQGSVSHLKWKAGWIWFVTGLMNIDCQLIVVHSDYSALFFVLHWDTVVHWHRETKCFHFDISIFLSTVFIYQHICKKVCMQKQMAEEVNSGMGRD